MALNTLKCNYVLHFKSLIESTGRIAVAYNALCDSSSHRLDNAPKCSAARLLAYRRYQWHRRATIMSCNDACVSCY